VTRREELESCYVGRDCGGQQLAYVFPFDFLTSIKDADCDPVVVLSAASLAAKALLTPRMLPMKTMVVVGIGLLSLILASRTEAKPPKYVREACHDQAVKFCAAVIRNTEARQACMRKHHDELSADCKAAIAKWHGKEAGTVPAEKE
jgi:hypothetical protein